MIPFSKFIGFQNHPLFLNYLVCTLAWAGGNISITTNALFGIEFRDENIANRNDISASSQFGINGSVIIDTPEVDPTSGLMELPENLVNAETLIDQDSCRQNIENESKFSIVGREGLPVIPGNRLNSSNTWEDWRLVETNITFITHENPHNTSNLNQEENSLNITPARIWGITEDGEIILTEDTLYFSPQNNRFNQVSCTNF